MREPEGYREQLEFLTQRYPGEDMLTIQQVCKMFKCGRKKLLEDKTFPTKRIGNKGKYYVPIVGLARWMMTR